MVRNEERKFEPRDPKKPHEVMTHPHDSHRALMNVAGDACRSWSEGGCEECVRATESNHQEKMQRKDELEKTRRNSPEFPVG